MAEKDIPHPIHLWETSILEKKYLTQVAWLPQKVLYKRLKSYIILEEWKHLPI